MRKLSLWARDHRRIAITIIILSKLLLAFAAYFIGISLLEMSIHIPIGVFIAGFLLFIIASLLYPSRKNSVLSKAEFYVRQKSCDLIIAASSFVMIATLVNTDLPVPANPVAASTTISKDPSAEEILASLKYRDKSTLTRKEKRILKQEFKDQIKVYAIAKLKGEKDSAGKAGLIILTIIGALGLLVLVASLACSLSCNGSDAAAIVVGILGTVAIVWGAVALIHRISRGPRKKKVETPAVGM